MENDGFDVGSGITIFTISKMGLISLIGGAFIIFIARQAKLRKIRAAAGMLIG
jgi:hypothetical protein